MENNVDIKKSKEIYDNLVSLLSLIHIDELKESGGYVEGYVDNLECSINMVKNELKSEDFINNKEKAYTIINALDTDLSGLCLYNEKLGKCVGSCFSLINYWNFDEEIDFKNKLFNDMKLKAYQNLEGYFNDLKIDFETLNKEENKNKNFLWFSRRLGTELINLDEGTNFSSLKYHVSDVNDPSFKEVYFINIHDKCFNAMDVNVIRNNIECINKLVDIRQKIYKIENRLKDSISEFYTYKDKDMDLKNLNVLKEEKEKLCNEFKESILVINNKNAKKEKDKGI